MIDNDRNPLGALRDLDVGEPPSIGTVELRHHRAKRRLRATRLAVGALATLSLGAAVAVLAGGGNSTIDSVGTTSTTSRTAPTSSSTPPTTDDTAITTAQTTNTTTPTSAVDSAGSLPSTPRTPDAAAIDDPSSCRIGSFLFTRDATPCYRARADAALIVRNDTARTLLLDFGATTWEIPPNGSEDFGGTEIQDLLGVGVHHLSDELPDIWVVDRAESPFTTITDISPQAFGPLRTDMIVDEAAQALDVDLVDQYPDLRADLGGCTFVQPVGPPDPYAPQLQVFFDSDLGAGQIVRIETSDPAIATPAGVRAGQTESELLETYGDQLVPFPGEGGRRYVLMPDTEPTLMFGVGVEPGATDQTPIITSIWIATTEAADLTEGCL